MDEENKEQRRTNNNESLDDDDDCEIEEELEGANSSLNLHDAAALERLPQLTSTPGVRSQKVDSPVVNSSHLEDTNLSPLSSSRSNHRPSDVVVNHVERKHSQSEKTKSMSVAPEVREGERKHRSQKYSNVPETHAEDLVVLSFSSSTGQSA